MTAVRTLFIIFLVSLFLASGASFASGWINDGLFHMECLHRGEKLVRYECDHDFCIVCQKYGFPYPGSYCAGQSMKCTGNGGPIDTQAPVITINQPKEKAIFGTRAVPFDIQTDESSTLYYFDYNGIQRSYIRICSGCTSYVKQLTFEDGSHKVSILATDSFLNSRSKNVSFTVDSKAPLITGTSPKAGTYTNGVFSVNYDEMNLKNVTLFWKTGSGTWNKVLKKDCPGGLKQSCTITVAVLPQGSITYYFNVADVATSVNSAEVTVYVDTVAPQLTKYSPVTKAYDSKKVFFNLTVTEPVTLEYTDHMDKKPRSKPMCKDCQSYAKALSFNDGKHRVSIVGTDKAGNKDNETVEFDVDSVKPKIKTMLPKKKGYANGTFSVQVDEKNLVSATLYYLENGTLTYKSASKNANECAYDGKYSTCVMSVKLTKQGPLTYYFKVTDIARSINSSVYDVIVDTVAPIMMVYKPLAGTYTDRSVKFNVTINEQVTLEYMDQNALTPRFTRLCSRCTKYASSKSFSYGEHNLVIRATDNAGNRDEHALKLNIASA